MTVYGTNNLVWKKNELYFKSQLLYEVVKSKDHKNLYKVKFPNGELSKDFYNLTRARDNAVNLSLEDINGGKV